MMRSLVVCLVAASFGSAADSDSVRQAIELFHQAKFEPAKFRAAAALFASASEAAALTAEQQTAWAYCRLRIAADDWNASRGSPAVAKLVAAEAAAALQLVPEHAELQKFGREVITAAGGESPGAVKPQAATGWFSLETESFRIRYPAAAKSLAEKLAIKAEEQRAFISNRWSGPLAMAWSVRCEIVVHASAEDFAHATGQPDTATGHALVHMNNGRPAIRRIDLRSDDDTAAEDALPRELTHVILADLFPSTPPPSWAAHGMATLAMSQGTVGRYLATAAALSKKGELPAASRLFESKISLTPESLIGSAALVEFLARAKGERSLTIFLRDISRYGLEKSLDRQFGFSMTALDAAMTKELKK